MERYIIIKLGGDYTITPQYKLLPLRNRTTRFFRHIFHRILAFSMAQLPKKK